jgi:hypothetical protein
MKVEFFQKFKKYLLWVLDELSYDPNFLFLNNFLNCHYDLIFFRETTNST